MARGGFKAFQVEMDGLLSSAALGDKKTAAANMLREIGEKLVSLGEGWDYDIGSEPLAYPDGTFSEMGDTPQTIFLGFSHSSGTKMLMAYNLYGTGYDVSSFASWDSSSRKYGSLSISMIPSGCGVYDYMSSNPIPDTGTLLLGQLCDYSSTKASAFLYNGEVGKKFRFTIVVRGTQIITIGQNQYGVTSGYDTRHINVVMFGNILSCAQDSDTCEYREYASIETYTDPSGNGRYSEKNYLSLSDSIYACSDTTYGSSQIFAQDGSRLDGYKGEVLCISDTQACNCMKSITHTVRFFPIHVYTKRNGGICSSGDGYKGIINPEVACIVTKEKLAMGTLLDGGNMIMLLGGLVVGWDPSNTVALV